MGCPTWTEGLDKRRGVSTVTESNCLCHMIFPLKPVKLSVQSMFWKPMAETWVEPDRTEPWRQTAIWTGRRLWGYTTRRRTQLSTVCCAVLYQFTSTSGNRRNATSVLLFPLKPVLPFPYSSQSSKCSTSSSLPWPCASSLSPACTASPSATTEPGEDQESDVLWLFLTFTSFHGSSHAGGEIPRWCLNIKCTCTECWYFKEYRAL